MVLGVSRNGGIHSPRRVLKSLPCYAFCTLLTPPSQFRIHHSRYHLLLINNHLTPPPYCSRWLILLAQSDLLVAPIFSCDHRNSLAAHISRCILVKTKNSAHAIRKLLFSLPPCGTPRVLDDTTRLFHPPALAVFVLLPLCRHGVLSAWVTPEPTRLLRVGFSVSSWH